MTTEQIRTRLQKCHEEENELNKELSKLDWQVKEALKKKKKIAIRISKNMKYRNNLIEKL